MNRELKKKWIEALRSGEYEQTTSVLQDHEGFCCLGVLCDLYNSDKWEWRKNESNARYEGCSALIPDHILKNLKLHHTTQDKLSSMNDGGFHTFVEIADWIEENIKED